MKNLAIGLNLTGGRLVSLTAEMQGEFSPEQELLVSHCITAALGVIAHKICDPEALILYKPAFKAPFQEEDRRGQGH